MVTCVALNGALESTAPTDRQSLRLWRGRRRNSLCAETPGEYDDQQRYRIARPASETHGGKMKCS
jgi:hypothetical protein